MIDEVSFRNANSRDTYFTVHNVKQAYKFSTGRGIKVGIIDWLFGVNENNTLYSGYVDISNHQQYLFESSGHGLMMAETLKEIAPDCEIYAINSVVHNESGTENRIEYFEKAIQWAVLNNIDILTYSQAAFFGDERIKANNAVKQAVENGIITTFIHNDSEYNIWPYGCMGFGNDQKFARTPDLNIYHFDYNTLFLPQYEKYMDVIKSGGKIDSGNDLPYFSFSSMSVVLGGFAAIIKSIKPAMSSSEVKELLKRTSYEVKLKGQHWYDINPCEHVVDIGNAVEQLT